MPRRKSYTEAFENRLKERTMIGVAFSSTVFCLLLAFLYFEQNNLPEIFSYVINTLSITVFIIDIITDQLFEWGIKQNPVPVIVVLFWTYFLVFRYLAKVIKMKFKIDRM